MSKQTTLITRAYMQYARAYEQWHADCQNIPIKVSAPRVLYLPGTGYEINGKVRKETAKQIIDSLNKSKLDCIRLIEESCRPTMPSVYERFVNSEPIYEVKPMEEVAEQTLVAL